MFWIKAMWAGIALIAPEYVLWRAIHQWETARKLCNEVNDYLFPGDEQIHTVPKNTLQSQTAPSSAPSSSGKPQEPPFNDQMAQPEAHSRPSVQHAPSTSNVSRDESIKLLLKPSQSFTDRSFIDRPSENELDLEKNQKHRWEMEHGFFAVMGGFQITVASEHEWVLEGDRILTPQGIVFFAKHGLLPDLPSKRLKERGKADQLAKTVVCAQAIWMVIQTAARKASGLPITLLELNTLAHVGCAVFMYAVWWKKPQNVSELIDVLISPRLGAALSSPSLREFRRKNQSPPPWVNIVFRPQDEQAPFSIPKSKVDSRVEDLISNFHGIINSDLKIRDPVRRDGVIMLLGCQGLEGSPFYYGGRYPQHLTQKAVTKLTSKSLLGEEDDITRDIDLFSFNSIKVWCQASNHNIEGNLQDVSQIKFLGILTVLGMLYAGLHALSWNAHFPTNVEAILWRAVVCYIGASGFIATVLTPIIDRAHKIHGYSHYLDVSFRTRFMGGVAKYGRYLGLLLIGILVACRCYLIVEAFISIRSLSFGSYSTVSWVNFLPHVG
jgi:hypothetical protein